MGLRKASVIDGSSCGNDDFSTQYYWFHFIIELACCMRLALVIPSMAALLQLVKVAESEMSHSSIHRSLPLSFV